MPPYTPPTSPQHSADSALSVSQLNRLAKQLLEDCFDQVEVIGEISNFSQPSSGHWYFTLKDKNAQIRCAMFRGRNFAVKFKPALGQQVQVKGKVSLYEGRGDYQLIADAMQPAGDGALALAFEQLKQELKSLGWFDESQKQALPKKIRHIAIITSASGAALQDVRSVLERRWPKMQVTLLPCLVQGSEAAGQIANAIDTVNRQYSSGEQNYDVLLVCRGGGSLEDLWAFNERIVAEAIYHSAIPVVSAVGHEVDFSIADFVADLRAPTPSAAAELLSPNRESLLVDLNALNRRLNQAQNRNIAERKLALQSLHGRIKHPGQLLSERAQRLDELEIRLMRQHQQTALRCKTALANLIRRLQASSPEKKLSQQKQRQQDLKQQLLRSMSNTLKQKQQQLAAQRLLLNSLGPQNILNRGYSILRDESGKVVKQRDQTNAGTKLSALLSDGEIKVTVD